ncbi:unnamed protein product [Peronospora effusa]|uniref:Uncharacterized protein n=1 Tax=Peronospora effusa TaxID=542832 RepID=A0A3M6VBC8_9STRA|nr:hypothetical protein DD238_005943 [Peronospora effusa]RQM12947.1 hypothetical protein DD237_006506 [Peronospora effusa]CAI5727441.1 unnamed protein product [Peronospora effusa]
MTKRRMFSTPSLRLPATTSAAAAASTASKIKSNLSTVTKLPTALKRSTISSTDTGNKAHVDDGGPTCTTIPSLSSSSTESSEESKAVPRMFGMSSLMSIRTGSKEKAPSKPASNCSFDSPAAQINRSNSNSSNSSNNSDEAAESNDEPKAQKSAVNSASRFVRGMPTLLRRAVSNSHIPDASGVIWKKASDASADSTSRREFMENSPENDRHSLLLMLQVPQTQRHSQVPLMAAGETW